MADPQQPQDVVPQQQGQAPLIPSPATPITSSAGENLQCQWLNCGERCSSPEALYEHVCERHVGRKSTNNLNLTCQWGSCRTTTVKRDHITSHIRVHVPLKPHKCDFCGKSFKRPQDLKKHVKTHADDSVIMPSPRPDGSARQGGGVYGQGDPKAPNYYAQAMNPGQGYDSGHQPNQYYQPQHTHQPSQHPAYGPVTYYTNGPGTQASLNDYEVRKRGFEALDQFFGEVKSRNFDPVSYQNVSQRLYELQGLQLPLITQQPVTAIPAYQPISALAGGSGDYGQDVTQAYSLPPMGNAKTRGDLTSIDHILEQMQAAIYENDQNLSQAGTAQPGAQWLGYRTSQSPPGVQLPSSHAHHNATIGQHQHHGSIVSATDSVHSNTPALTPPSSAQSFTSGHSPVSHPVSTPLQGPPSAAMYPTLPGHSGIDYANNTSAGNAATLGSVYDGEDNRPRYGGGRLQSAAPFRRPNKGSNDEAMDVSSDGSATPPAAASKSKGKQRKASPKTSVIDPALGGDSTQTSSSDRGGELSKEEAERQSIWVENMRLIEWMRDYVKKRLDRGEYDDDAEASNAAADTEMGGTEEERKAGALYPILKAVEGSA